MTNIPRQYWRRKSLKGLIQWHFILICSCLVWLSFSVLYSTGASAVSVYDDVIRVTDNLTITDSSGGNSYDFALNWYTEMLDVLEQRCSGLGGIDCDRHDLLENMVTDTGQWAVARSGDPTHQLYLTVYFSSNETGTADFSMYGGVPTFFLRSTLTQVAYTFSINPSATYKSTHNLAFAAAIDNGTTSALPHQDSDYDAYFLFINYPITYPPDYEGEQIPGEYTPPVPPSTLAPDIFMHSVVDFKGEFSDRNYLTTDGVLPVLCEPGGLVPVITLTLFYGTSSMGEPIDTIQASASSVFWIDFKAYDPSFGDFTIVSAYTCGEDSTPAFSEHSEYTFEVDENGFLVNQDFEQCITTEFPYVDFDACWSNITLLANRLSFDTISFAPDWRISDNGCRTLGTIGDWMHVEGSNRVVCPQFSSEVRTIVTPFVTFILGIVTLGILMTKTRREQF